VDDIILYTAEQSPQSNIRTIQIKQRLRRARETRRKYYHFTRQIWTKVMPKDVSIKETMIFKMSFAILKAIIYFVNQAMAYTTLTLLFPSQRLILERILRKSLFSTHHTNWTNVLNWIKYQALFFVCCVNCRHQCVNHHRVRRIQRNNQFSTFLGRGLNMARLSGVLIQRCSGFTGIQRRCWRVD
jgi:hypothetical protein